MYAIRMHEYGTAEQLRGEHVDDPSPGPGQVRVVVKAAGAQLIDTWLQEGEPVAGIPAPRLPYTPGSEIAGHVDAVGDGVRHDWIGEPIAVELADGGGYAQLAVADLDRVHRLSAATDLSAAVAMITTGKTTMAILELAEVTGEDTVLVTAAAGGIGSLLVQRARNLGATVIGAAGGPAKAELVARLGADVAVDYNTPNWTDEVRRPVTVVLDGVGGHHAAAAYRMVGEHGRIVNFGTAAQRGDLKPAPVPAGVEYRSLFDSPQAARFMDPIGACDYQRQALSAAASGELTPLVQSYPLSEAATAQHDLRSRATTGKVVLLP